jgi:hypothetical protein
MPRRAQSQRESERPTLSPQRAVELLRQQLQRLDGIIKLTVMTLRLRGGSQLPKTSCMGPLDNLTGKHTRIRKRFVSFRLGCVTRPNLFAMLDL